MDGLAEALGSHHTRIPLIAWLVVPSARLAAMPCSTGTHAVALPINIGGPPLNSWPAFVPVTFELSVLFAALFILGALLVLNGLPQPYHPVFNVPAFARASRDRFFLCVEARDARFEPQRTREFLGYGPREVSDVPA